ncbi:MAG: hypothetical protein GXO88_08175 [Chlorobi bacterium]|nr:hypothetical protein [Chlorobiota bacterium]
MVNHRLKYNNIFTYCLLGILLLSFALINVSRKSEHRQQFVDGDGSGYYAWLPTLFMYKTLDFTDVFNAGKIRKGKDYQGHNYHRVNGLLINKFPPGTAFLMMPFFLIALFISFIFGLPIDAYEPIFQYSAGIAAVFWCWTGLIFLYKTLKTYNLSEKERIMLVLASIFATNLFAYTFLMPAFSHVYSFAAISIVIYSVRKYFLEQGTKYLIIGALSLGFVFMIRPVNLLILVFLPFLADDINNFGTMVLHKLKSMKFIYAILFFFIGIFPYLLINYNQTGSFIYFPYKNEGFYWSRPEIFDFLFSFRKGWFVYTPFYLLLFPSVIFLYIKNKFRFLWFISFFFVLIYVFSSWWNWFYGDSFGMRPMLDHTTAFILVIALFYSGLRKYTKRAVVVFVILAGMLNVVQTYQYAKGIIHPDSMNKEAYLKVFLKTSEKYSGIISGGPEYYYGKLKSGPFYHEKYDFESRLTSLSKLRKTDTAIVYSGRNSIKLDNHNIYSPSLNWILPDSLEGRRNLYVKISSMVYEKQKNSAAKALFIMDIQDKEGNTVFYKKARLKQMPDNKFGLWEIRGTGFKLPYLTKNHYLLKIYIWNKEKSVFYLDDLNIEFYEYTDKNL